MNNFYLIVFLRRVMAKNNISCNNIGKDTNEDWH